MAERFGLNEELRRALQFGPQPLADQIGGGSHLPMTSPPPLPTRSEMESLFQLNAVELSTHNNFFFADGKLGDEGPTGGGMLGLQLGNVGCTSFGVGGDLKAYTALNGARNGGVDRDDEARLYVSFGQEGACVQPLVDRLRPILPWANITSVSWKGRVGGDGTGNYGGLMFQEAIHEELGTGGTTAKHSLPMRYGPRRAGLYTMMSGYAGSRLGDGPVSVGLRLTGEVAPAGTSRATAGFELQIQKNGFYATIGFSGTIQQSSMSDFAGARLDGAYPTASGALGYEGDHGDRLEFRIAENDLGTGLGLRSLSDEKNLTASVMVRITRAGFFDFLQKLRF